MKRKKEVVLFKVDSEKSYNSVDWKFIDCMMVNFGFNENWRSWVS